MTFQKMNKNSKKLIMREIIKNSLKNNKNFKN